MMEKISQLLQARYEDVARTISEEMGSPISFSIMGQVFASTMVLDYYTNLAREYQFEEFRQGALGPVLVRREPVGVAGCIVPWNVPLFTIMLKMGPALASGSTVVLKPAPETPLDAYLLADVLEEVGLPRGSGQHRGRGPRRRRAPRHAPRRRQDQLHRLHRGREADRRALRRAAQALHPRARGQVGGDHPRRRRPRHCDPRLAAELDHEQRPGVHRADPHPRVARALRRRRRRARGGDVGGEGRRAARPRDRRRPARRVTPARSGRGLHRQGPGGRRSRGRRRRPSRGVRDRAGSSSRPCSPTSTTR